MKTRFLMLLAALLLGSASAFAQSGNNEPLKGDVNGDGKVDVADITAVIKIMKDGGGTSEETKYYWYAGQTQPSSMTSNPTVDDTNFTNNKWHTLNGNQISQTIKGGTAGNSWYVAVPTSKSFKPCASDLVTPETSWDKISTITVNSVNYDIWKTYSTGAKLNVYMIQQIQNQQYYTYIGPDASFKIVDEDGNLKPNAATNIEYMPGVKTSTTLPKSLNDSYPIGTEIKGAEIGNDYVYIIGLASLFNKTTYLVAPTGSPIMMDDLGTFTKDSNIYKVLSTRGPVSTVIVQ